jgi:hypothetical protein
VGKSAWESFMNSQSVSWLDFVEGSCQWTV